MQTRATKGAKSHALWEKEHPVLNTWGNVLGAAPFAVASAPLAAAAGSGIGALADAAAATAIGQGVTNFLAPIAGTSIAGASIPKWLDLGLTSAFGAHGIQTAINEGGISPTTAFEIAPLGRLARPIYNVGKEGLQYATKGVDNATRYTSPSYDLYRTIGENPIVKRSFPIKSLYRADVYRGGKIRNPRNISLTTDPKYAEQYGEVTPYLFESKSVAKTKEPLMGYSDPVNNDMFIYHNTKDVPGANAIVGHDLVTGEFPYNSKGTEIISLSPNNIYPKRLNPSTIKWADAAKTPQITSENASNITPEQWTTAQDAAIAKGDIAEAQRLRDLHFKVSAPNTVVKNIDGMPARVYHGTYNKGWVSYDKRKFGSATDNGLFGEGLYATSDKKYADVYARGNNADGTYKGEIKDLYINAKKPFYVYNRKDLSPTELINREDAAYQFGRDLKVQGDVPNSIWDEMNNSDIVIETKGTKRPNFAEIVIPKGEQIKSANAVTYDNNGVRIPLGKRDNFKLNDIRYGVLPFGVGLTGYGLFNKNR